MRFLHTEFFGNRSAIHGTVVKIQRTRKDLTKVCNCGRTSKHRSPFCGEKIVLKILNEWK